jgi:hypothetical protein
MGTAIHTAAEPSRLEWNGSQAHGRLWMAAESLAAETRTITNRGARCRRLDSALTGWFRTGPRRGPGPSGLPRLSASLPEQRVCAGTNALAGDLRRRRVVSSDRLAGARPPRRSAQGLEGFEVVWKDGPHRSHLDPVQALLQQQVANVSLRRFELGCSFRHRKKTWPVHEKNINTPPQPFLLYCEQFLD